MVVRELTTFTVNKTMRVKKPSIVTGLIKWFFEKKWAIFEIFKGKRFSGLTNFQGTR